MTKTAEAVLIQGAPQKKTKKNKGESVGCFCVSTDGPQPTQGAPKKKKKRRKAGRLFFGIVFLSLVFFFFFFGGPLMVLIAFPPVAVWRAVFFSFPFFCWEAPRPSGRAVIQ
jgi:hypothetical protein